MIVAGFALPHVAMIPLAVLIGPSFIDDQAQWTFESGRWESWILWHSAVWSFVGVLLVAVGSWKYLPSLMPRVKWDVAPFFMLIPSVLAAGMNTLIAVVLSVVVRVAFCRFTSF